MYFAENSWHVTLGAPNDVNRVTEYKLKAKARHSSDNTPYVATPRPWAARPRSCTPKLRPWATRTRPWASRPRPKTLELGPRPRPDILDLVPACCTLWRNQCAVLIIISSLIQTLMIAKA